MKAPVRATPLAHQRPQREDQGPSRSGEKKEAEAILRRFRIAERRWHQWHDLWQDCYDYAMPNREGFFGHIAGEKRTTFIYDDTAVTSLQNFASRLASTMIPEFVRWVDLKAGRGIPARQRAEADRALAEVNEYMFEVINNSNFGQEAHEALLELGIGTGALAINPAGPDEIIRATAVPLSQLVLERGPDDRPGAVYWPRKVRLADVPVRWPDATIPPELARRIQTNPLHEEEFIEATMRDWSRPFEHVYQWRVLWPKGKEIIASATMEGIGSSPWVAFRWSVAASEVYGRGPLLNTLPSVKTVNLVTEMILQNADMAISGIWQIEDDGVVNPDTIQLLPGTIIPKMKGAEGLVPIGPAGNFDVGELVIEKMQINIRRALYDDMLPPVDQTPVSATEFAGRQAELAQRIGAAFRRLMVEMVAATVRRVLRILTDQGRVEIPRVDGRLVKIVPVSPLAQQQEMEDILNIDRYLETLMNRYGPEMVALVTKPEETAEILGEKYRVPPRMIRNAIERAQLVKQVQNAAQQLPPPGA